MELTIKGVYNKKEGYYFFWGPKCGGGCAKNRAFNIRRNFAYVHPYHLLKMTHYFKLIVGQKSFKIIKSSNKNRRKLIFTIEESHI